MSSRTLQLTIWGLLLLALSGMLSVATAANRVTTTLDRDHVALGDTVTLSLHFPDSGSMTAPDLTPLRKDFEVLGQSSGTIQDWDNGRVKAIYALAITLRPLHAGTLQIPALDVGGTQTSPLTLHVAEASAQGPGHAGDAVFVETTLDTDHAYVGQQVALDVRLYYATTLIDGGLSTPSAGDAQIRMLGREKRYQTQRNGRIYGVVERHYALIPQHPGALQVAPIVFRGHEMGRSTMGDFFSNAREVSAHSKSLQLKVKAKPAQAGPGPWLPARQLELNLSGIPASGQVQVGEPVTVTVQEGATGLAAESLPEPTLPDLLGADIYPDQPQDVTRNNEQWITGSRSRSFAIVPSKTGTLHIPPITLRWWNVVADHEETARIPAYTLHVVAAGHAGAGGTVPPANLTRPAPARTVEPHASAAGGTPEPATAGAPASSAATGGIWRPVALASLLLWLASVLAGAARWWHVRSSRRRRTASAGAATQMQSGRVRTLRNAFLVAARSGDLHAAAPALLAWAKAEQPDVRHLKDLSERLDAADQVAAIEILQRSCYAADGSKKDADGRIADAFSRGLAWRETGKAEKADREVLPPLYPPSS